jgi:filamentous hemagglutinin family protein
MTRLTNKTTSRRSRLLGRSALCGVLGALVIGATPALAQVTGVGTVTGAGSNGGAPGIVSGGGVTDVTLGGSRSIVNWSSLNVTSSESLNFHFNSRGDIVVNRVAGAAAINGALTACLASCATPGGNIWILSTAGVLIGPDAQINTGGFLASTGQLTDADILDGDMNFAFTGAPDGSTVSVASGAAINANGGAIALIAPVVTTAAGSTITGTDGSDVTYGSAENYNVTFAQTASDDLDLITFQVPSKSDGAGGTPGLILNGTTDANQVFAAIVSKTGVAASILLGGSITATTASGENGDIILSAGAGITNGAADDPSGGVEGGIVQEPAGTLTAENVTMRAAGDIAVGDMLAADTVSLESSSGGISQTGAITTSALNASAATGITLDGLNDIASVVLGNSTSGDIIFAGVDGFTAQATNGGTGDVTLDALSGVLGIGGVTSAGGSVFLRSLEGVSSPYEIIAGEDIEVSTEVGDVFISKATAGGDITLTATDSGVVLGAAALTGATGNLILDATGGDAILGALDYTAITGDNIFSRAPGSTGVTRVMATGGDALVYLRASSAIDEVTGEFVDITVESGDLTVGSLIALSDDIYVEVLDGTLTVGDADAGYGGVDLNAFGGDLFVTGTVYGLLGVRALTDGLLDGSQAVSIHTDGDLDLTGGDVLLGSVSAEGNVFIGAVTGDASVDYIEAGETAQVIALAGNATLRAASAVDGLAVIAEQTATLGADDRAGITNFNSVLTGGCGCGFGGIAILSNSGDVRVNLNDVVGTFDVIGAAIDGDVTVNLLNGDLTIGDLAGYNISLEVDQGVIDAAFVVSSGGDYRLKAQDSLGASLDPQLFFGTLRSFTLIDTLGGLDFHGTVVTEAGIRIEVWDGALTGTSSLSAGNGASGDVIVFAGAIEANDISANGDVTLTAAAGSVDIATDVAVGGNYDLTGQDFSLGALSPVGLRSGLMTIVDTLGGLDFSGAPLAYNGGIVIDTGGEALVGGAVTSANGDIAINAGRVEVGDLSALQGTVEVAADGAIEVVSAIALDLIDLHSAAGDVTLGAATVQAPGALRVRTDGAGSATLGAASPADITTANIFAGVDGVTAEVSSALGQAQVNLDLSAELTLVSGQGGAAVTVFNGDLAIGSIVSQGSGASVEGPAGQLTIGSVSAAADAQLTGGAVELADANVAGDLSVSATTDILLRGGSVGADRMVLSAGGSIDQMSSSLVSDRLSLQANEATLMGANAIAELGDIRVTTGGLVYNSAIAFDIAGTIDAAGQDVRLTADGAIRETGAGRILAGDLSAIGTGGLSLGGANAIEKLGDIAGIGGDILINNVQALLINGAVTSQGGSVTLRSHGGMTIGSTGRLASDSGGDSVVLASDGVFTNAAGAGAIDPGSGRWLIYSQAAGDPGGSTAGNAFGGLAGRSFYGSAYDFTTGTFGATPNAGNRFVYAYQPTLTVTPISQTATYSGAIPGLSTLISGLINGDLAADAWSGQAAINGAGSKNVGTYNLSAALGSLLSDMNYAFAFGTGTLVINPKVLTGAVLANDKTYDGSAAASGTIILTGVIAGETVLANGALSFADRNAATGKTVTANGVALGGLDSGNYVLSSVSQDTADIFRRALSGSVTANSKTYDGNTSATGTINLSGVVAGDDVRVSGALAFDGRDAATGRSVNASGAALSGADAGNYTIGGISAGIADILRRALNGSVSANSKTYDGNTSATGTINLSGVVAGDDVRVSSLFNFDGSDAATGRSVTASGASLSGSDAGNYTIGGISAGIADILKRAITIAADDKSKRAGQADPALTYTIGGSGLVQGETLSGRLLRAAGEYAGAYAIGQGDLTASSNYTVTFTGGTLTITVPPPQVNQGVQALHDLNEPVGFSLDRDPSAGVIFEDGPPIPGPASQP